jgi:hypothetical protein
MCGFCAGIESGVRQLPPTKAGLRRAGAQPLHLIAGVFQRSDCAHEPDAAKPEQATKVNAIGS